MYIGRMVATTIETIDGWTRMVYHKTCVAEFKPFADDKPTHAVKLNTGGFDTATTKKRMNQFAKMFDLGFSVYQQKGQWYISIKGQDTPMTFDTHAVTFIVGE